MDDGQMHLFPLTPEEANERAKRQAAMVLEYRRVEQLKKDTNRELTGQLKSLRAEYETLAEAVVSGKEWRQLLDGEAPYLEP